MEEQIIVKLCSDIGEVKKGIVNLEGHITRLDKRCNGTFDTIGDHIKESPYYRASIDTLKAEVKNIKEERHNTAKEAQWRVGIICGIPAVILMILKILEYFK